MSSTYLHERITAIPTVRIFKHREYLPAIQGVLWQINSGMVRTIATHEDGTAITFELWGVGDVVGYPVTGTKLYQFECLGEVRVQQFKTSDAEVLNQIMQSRIDRVQILLTIRHGLMEARLKALLRLLANKFGSRTKEGYYIPNLLTHQDVAEIIDSTRVTVSRLIGQLERQGIVCWSRTWCLVYEEYLNEDELFTQPSNLTKQ